VVLLLEACKSYIELTMCKNSLSHPLSSFIVVIHDFIQAPRASWRSPARASSASHWFLQMIGSRSFSE
jgi:hypothetical protein